MGGQQEGCGDWRRLEGGFDGEEDMGMAVWVGGRFIKIVSFFLLKIIFFQ